MRLRQGVSGSGSALRLSLWTRARERTCGRITGNGNMKRHIISMRCVHMLFAARHQNRDREAHSHLTWVSRDRQTSLLLQDQDRREQIRRLDCPDLFQVNTKESTKTTLPIYASRLVQVGQVLLKAYFHQKALSKSNQRIAISALG